MKHHTLIMVTQTYIVLQAVFIITYQFHEQVDDPTGYLGYLQQSITSMRRNRPLVCDILNY